MLVDGKEIAPDETEVEATHFHTTIPLTEAECCANLGQKIKIGESKLADEYRFGVRISKKYQSLDWLPPQVTVAVSATTDKGTVEMTRTLNLKEYEDSSFIRFH